MYQPDLTSEVVADRARSFEREAAAMRMFPRKKRARHAAAGSLRRLADRLDGAPAPMGRAGVLRLP
jgi:hypothetical protein